MQKKLTVRECQKKLFDVGIKLGVSPRLISCRLLSLQDKKDMLDGLITDEALFYAVKGWMEARMPDYSGNATDGDSDEIVLKPSECIG